jgi:hypothetical protein
VSIWRDLGNSQLSLATAWSVTTAFILGAFMVVALKESWSNAHPPKNVRNTGELANHLDDEPEPLRTTVIVPPALEDTLGIRRSDLVDPHAGTHDDTRTYSDHDNDNSRTDERTAPSPAGARRAATEEAEVAAK